MTRFMPGARSADPVLHRHAFMFDVDDSAAGAVADPPGGGEAAADPPTDPAAVGDQGSASEPSGAAAAAAPPFDPSDPAFAQAVAEIVASATPAQLEQILSQYADDTDGQPAQDEFEFDLFGDNPGAQLRSMFRSEREQTVAEIKQLIEPLRQSYEQQQQAENDARLKDVIADVASREGELRGENANARVLDAARQIARQLVPQLGESDRVAEMAITKAYRNEAAYEKAIADKAVEQYKNELAGLGRAPAEPGAGAAGLTRAPVEGDELALARHYASQPRA